MALTLTAAGACGDDEEVPPRYDFVATARGDAATPQLVAGRARDAGELDQVTELGGWAPAWVGADRIAFVTDRDGPDELYWLEPRLGLLNRLTRTDTAETLVATHGGIAFASGSTIVAPSGRGDEVDFRIECGGRVESMDWIQALGPNDKQLLGYVCQRENGAHELGVKTVTRFPLAVGPSLSLGAVGTGVQWFRFDGPPYDGSEPPADFEEGVLMLLDAGIVRVSFPSGEVTRVTDDPTDRYLSRGANRELYFVRGEPGTSAVYRYDGTFELMFEGDGPISASDAGLVQTDGSVIRLFRGSTVNTYGEPGFAYGEPSIIHVPPISSPD